MNPHTSTSTDLDTLFNVGQQLFDKYPIWSEGYRETLNKKILSHFFMREIGYETVAMWRFALNRKLNEIMPYYNDLYKVAIQIDRPLSNYDGTIKLDGKTTQTGNNVTNGNTHTTTDTDNTTDMSNNVVDDGNTSDHYTDDRDIDNDGSVKNNVDKTHEYNVTDNTDVKDTYEGVDTTTIGGGHTEIMTGGHDTTKEGSVAVENGSTINESDTPQGHITSLGSGYLTKSTSNDGLQTTTYNGQKDTVTYNSETRQTTYDGEETSTQYGHSVLKQGDVHKTGTETDKGYDESITDMHSDDFITHDGSSTSHNDRNETGKTTFDGNTVTDSNNNVTVDTSNTESSDNTSKQTGRYGVSQSKLFEEYKDVLVNIDLLIINELEDLFMQIW